MKEAEEAKTFSEGQILELEAKLKEMDTVGDIKGVTMAEVSLNSDNWLCALGRLANSKRAGNCQVP